MNYIKLFLLTHLKYWWIYFAVIFTSLFGLLVALLFVGRVLYAWSIYPEVNLVASSLTTSMIGAAPLLMVNYKVAQSSKKENIVALTMLNHFITMVAFYAIAHFSLYWLIIDFRE
ncbi:putative membrane protein YqjE [Paenibacillus sp. DS2015]|uniref:hypothetical protein n=1 Tax=Paenibacillus sp. DS2015 TaxID=3373917 RepID=UPI003D260FC2